MNLSYSITAATFQHNEKRHPQEVIKALGIKYDRAECFAIADHWVFYNCRNVPDKLPAFIIRVEEKAKMPNCPACNGVGRFWEIDMTTKKAEANEEICALCEGTGICKYSQDEYYYVERGLDGYYCKTSDRSLIQRVKYSGCLR